MSEQGKWYVAQTYSGYEKKVKTTIEKAVDNRGLHEVIFEIRIPTEMVTEVKDSKKIEVERKLFPGYVLVKMVMTDESWHVVRNTRGVTGFVGNSTKPIPLTDAEIRALGVEKHELIIGYAMGDTVRITDGALEGYMGIVDEINESQGKVRVLVSMFGRETPVELDFDQAELPNGE